MLQKHKYKPELANERGILLRQQYIDNPELKEKTSKAQKKRFENQEERKKLSDIRKQLLIDHPELKINKSMPLKPFNVYNKEKQLIGSYNYKFEAVDDIRKKYDITLYSANIHKVLEGTSKSSKGLIFKYV
jgi:hypothetical protein